jgi:hypothetical protein
VAEKVKAWRIFRTKPRNYRDTPRTGSEEIQAVSTG